MVSEDGSTAAAQQLLATGGTQGKQGNSVVVAGPPKFLRIVVAPAQPRYGDFGFLWHASRRAEPLGGLES